ncbi:MAG: four helix bundle protein [Calditrichia bacterium]|nr:four helix bundle protein [Calditrichia bacterium]
MTKEYNFSNENEIINQIIREETKDYNIEFRERLLMFAVDIIKFLFTIPRIPEYNVLRYQLSKAGSSVGANYEESQSSSYKEFGQKTRISLREANESKFWLRVIDKLKIGDRKKLDYLMIEAEEISRILGSIVSKVDKKLKSVNR